MISVVIPLYNKEPIIERTLKSVLSQDYDDFEVVVVDDGSTDKSLSLALSCREVAKVPMNVITQENGGPSKARNTGVKHAKGEWIVFLDADDELLPGALRIMHAKTLEYRDADLIDFDRYFRFGEKLVHQRAHPINGYVNNPLCALYYWVIAPGCGHTIYSKNLVLKFPYDERLRRLEDLEILMRILPNAKVYSSTEFTEIHDVNFVQASNPRKDIFEDYTGYLNLKGGFWSRMRVYRTFIEERLNYPEMCKRLYGKWYYRYDLLIILKLLHNFEKWIIKTCL